MVRRQQLKLVAAIGILALLLSICAAVSLGQSSGKPAKTIFIDSEGKLIPNNEFVDLRLANPSGKDIAAKTVLEDGTIEFRLARVPQEGTVAPVFEAPVIGGETLNTDTMKGKVLVLNFWFIGCTGCVEEMPKLNRLAAKYAQNADIEFVAISPNTEQELRDFLTRERFDYKMVGRARSIINLFAFMGFPRNIVIGRDGKIAYWRTTVRAWDKFDSVIRAELAKN